MTSPASPIDDLCREFAGAHFPPEVNIYAHPRELPPGKYAVALGVFDGVHLGHQAIFRELCHLAQSHGGEPAALFFAPHPRAVVAPPAPQELTNIRMRIQAIIKAGVRHVVIYPFTREFAALSPEQFLGENFPAEKIVGFCVGENWRFGRENSGTPQFLQRWSREHRAETVVVPSVLQGGKPVSSTRIRQAISIGNLEQAAEMLGRRYSIGGVILHGWRNGHNLTKFPTANLDASAGMLPPSGVYAVKTMLDGCVQDGICYVGTAPSIRKDVVSYLAEIHLFTTPEQELYGRFAEVEFWGFVRSEMLFSSPEALSQQIEQDIGTAQKILKGEI